MVDLFNTWLDLRDDAVKKAKAQGLLAPLSALGAGTIREDDDDETIAFSGTYLGRAFRVMIEWHTGRFAMMAKVANERDGEDRSLDVDFEAGAVPLPVKPRDAFDDDDDPPKLRHFLAPGVFLEDVQAEIDRQLALLTGLVPGLIVQLIQSTSARRVRLSDDRLHVYFDVHVLMVDLVRFTQTALDFIQQITRELAC